MAEREGGRVGGWVRWIRWNGVGFLWTDMLGFWLVLVGFVELIRQPTC